MNGHSGGSSRASLDEQAMQPSRPQQDRDVSEDTPLLAREEGDGQEGHDTRQSSATSLLRSLQTRSRKGRRWPSLIALLILCIIAILIMVLGFFAPSTVQDYAMQAIEFEPTSLSIDSFTTTGITARVQGDFTMDASKVKKTSTRNFGRFATWIAREVESGDAPAEVSLPEYGNVVLGTAQVPSIKVDVRNGHTTHVDFLTDLQPGEVEGIRRIAREWVDGRLGQLRVQGKATVPIRSGLFSFGRQTISQTLLFANDDMPQLPAYKIRKLNFHDAKLPDFQNGMAADVSVELENEYPVDLTIPPLGFMILVDNCSPMDPFIQLADATTPNLHIVPKQDVQLNASGIVRRLPQAFTQACPGSQSSPMDLLLDNYIHGKDTTVYVRGSDAPSSDTPKWVTDIISDITVPLPLPGHALGHLVKDFSLAHVHFGLPDPFAQPGTPEASPSISAVVKALITLPEEMNFELDVNRVRSIADVFYKGSKLGNLNLTQWQPANSTRLESTDDSAPTLLVEAPIEKAPLTVTDEDVLADVVQALLFGGKSVYLSIKADVDVKLDTALGELAVRGIPATGSVPIKRS